MITALTSRVKVLMRQADKKLFDSDSSSMFIFLRKFRIAQFRKTNSMVNLLIKKQALQF